jgi:hypothetical protein
MLKSVKSENDQARRPRPNHRSATSHPAKGTVEVTERALDALAMLRTAEKPMPRQAIGLVVGPVGKVILVLDSPSEHDCVFTRDDTPIFFVASDVVMRFRGRILDRDTSLGKGKFFLAESPPADVVQSLHEG